LLQIASASSDHPEFSIKSLIIVVGKIFGLPFPLYLAYYNEFFSLWMWPAVKSGWAVAARRPEALRNFTA